ncbi:MAG: hypothetical protein JO278_15755, partial [Dyella sp.]|nr:hypothetical protein [Dyella sp.]
ITAFGGKLKPEDILQIAKRGGNAWHAIGIENLAPVMVGAADMGGSNEGTALMSLRQFQMGAVTLSKQQGDLLSELGLLDMTKAHKTGFGGSRLQLDPGAMKGSLEYSDNLPGWIKDVVYPAIEKASHGDGALLDNILGKLSSNRSVTKQLQMFGDEGYLDQVRKDLNLKNQVMPIDEAYDTMLNGKGKAPADYTANMKALQTQWESMLEAFGGPAAQALIPTLRNWTAALTSIGNWANSHQGDTKTLVELAKGLAEIGVVFGAFKMTKGIGSMMFGGGGAFGLRGAATALDGSASALTRAAAVLGGESAAGGASGGKKGLSTASKMLNALPWIGAAFTFADMERGIESDAWKEAGGDPSKMPLWMRLNHLGWNDQLDPLKPYRDEMQRRLFGPGPGVGAAGSATAPGTPQFFIDTPGFHPSKDELPNSRSSGSATLQAQVNTTVPFTVNVDGNKVADAVLPKIEQRLETMFSRMGNALMDGRHNDIGSHLSPGSVGAN